VFAQNLRFVLEQALRGRPRYAAPTGLPALKARAITLVLLISEGQPARLQGPDGGQPHQK